MKRSIVICMFGMAAACSDASDADVGIDAEPSDAGSTDRAELDAETELDASEPDAEPTDQGCIAAPAEALCTATECRIPAGCFAMGSPEVENCRAPDETRHEVRLTHDIMLSRHELSRGEIAAVLGYDPFRGVLAEYPAALLSWHEVASYANRRSEADGLTLCYECQGTGPAVRCAAAAGLASIYDCSGYRHPTEAEWEYAYRAGNGAALYSGDELEECSIDLAAGLVGWYGGNTRAVHKSGERAPNAYGLYDMAGNIAEWTFDGPRPHDAEATIDPAIGAGPEDARVYRGGLWDRVSEQLRAASRPTAPASTGDYRIGVRLARTVPANEPRPPSADAGVADTGVECGRLDLEAPIQGPGGPRVHVVATWEGGRARFLFDTGAPESSFYFPPDAPTRIPGLGFLELGCERVPLDARNIRFGQVVDGDPVLGAFGLDFINARPSVLDLSAQTLTRYPSEADLPDLATWSQLPVTYVLGRMIVDAELDGMPVRLLVDTGTQRTLWFGQMGRVGDTVRVLVGQGGEQSDAYEGDGTIAIAGEPAFTQVIWRVPESPSLEALFDSLGGIDGILGLATFGDRQVAFGAPRSVVQLGPP